MALHITTRTSVRLLALALAAVALAPLGSAALAGERDPAAACAGADLLPHGASIRAVVHSTLCLVNAERSRRGIHRLRYDRRLSRIGASHARDMVRRGYFSHSTPDGRDLYERVAATGYARTRRRGRWRVGENLAWGRSHESRPAAIVAAWMRSRSHRRIMLSRRFHQIGIAVVRHGPDARGGPAATYVAEFGAR